MRFGLISSLESPVVAEIWFDFGFYGAVFESGWWVLVGVEIGVGGWWVLWWR